MRLTGIRAKNIKPIEAFEASGLSDVVVLAGPNGVGKSRLIWSILEYLRGARTHDIALQFEATSPAEEQAWNKRTLDTSSPLDVSLLRQFLHKNQNRHNFQSGILNFDSDRSIQNIQPYIFSWEAKDPWDELVGWDMTWNVLKHRFQDTLHAIFRKVHNLELKVAAKARELRRQGKTDMKLDFEDPLTPFRDVFSQLLAPKMLLDADIKNQRLTYEYGGQVFGLEALSSGEKEVLNITFDFLLRSPSHCIVFFDEPELHLHPELSYRLLSTMRSIGTKNQFILCTHSPDIISASLDQSVIFVAPKTKSIENQAIVVREDNETNQALRLLGHSIGIVALGKRIVLVEGTATSLDKQLYGSILKSAFSSLVLVPSGGKQTITSFHTVVQNVLEKTLWGVEFFMLCDRDAIPLAADAKQIEAESNGRLRVLPKYHLENFFLDENVLAKVFEQLEPAESWLRSPKAIREELRSLAKGLVSYTVALLVSKDFRLEVGNIDLMPKDCTGKNETEITVKLVQSATSERSRVNDGLDHQKLTDATSRYFKRIETFLEQDDPQWKDIIPGKPLFGQFASKANLDFPRLKNAYIRCSEGMDPSPFRDIYEIFDSFSKL